MPPPFSYLLTVATLGLPGQWWVTAIETVQLAASSEQDFPGGSAGKESACSAGDMGSIPRLGRSPGEGKGYLLQYSGLKNSMDYIIHGIAKTRTRLSNFHFTSLHYL